MKRYLSLILCALLMCSLLAACGSSSGNMAADMGYIEMESVKGESAEVGYDGALTSDTSLNTTGGADRKLIKIVNISAESQDFTALMSSLDTKITELSGYVERREQNNGSRRSCSMTIRIPADSLDQFVEHVSANANVICAVESATDVTLEYVDTEAKVKALETEQTRLLELLAKADSLSDILEIEARLGDVTYELERYASRLRSLDNQVSYATVYLSVREVEVLTPKETPTVWQRISTGFVQSVTDLGENLTNVFVWIIVESPNLVVWAGILTGIWMVVKRISKRKPKAAPPTPPPAKPE